MRRVWVGPVVAVVAVAVVVAAVLLSRVGGSGGSGGSARNGATPANGQGVESGSPNKPPSSQSARPTVTLAYPADGERVPPGFVARGRAENLGASSVWLLNQDGGFVVGRPAPVENGEWTVAQGSLAGVKGQRELFLVAVLADARCATRLAAVARSRTGATAKLPAGCTVVNTASVRLAAR